jgi:hypothetical protein
LTIAKGKNFQQSQRLLVLLILRNALYDQGCFTVLGDHQGLSLFRQPTRDLSGMGFEITDGVCSSG